MAYLNNKLTFKKQTHYSRDNQRRANLSQQQQQQQQQGRARAPGYVTGKWLLVCNLQSNEESLNNFNATPLSVCARVRANADRVVVACLLFGGCGQRVTREKLEKNFLPA